jgi:hypothetical protein
MAENNHKAALFKKIAEVMGKVERVPKNGYNSFHKYQYVTESDLIESVRKFMAEAGLVVFNNVEKYEIDGELATVTIKFTLACTDTGETVESIMIGQGQDKGDKAFYKAYAGATKYFLMKTFLIPTGDDPEKDTDTSPNVQKGVNSASKNQTKPNTPPPNKTSWKSILDAEKELVTAAGTDLTSVRAELKKVFGQLPMYKELDPAKVELILNQLNKWVDNYKHPQA